jgi:hypothetical protein
VGNVEQHKHPLPKRAWTVEEPGHDQLSECRKQRARDDLPAECEQKNEGGGQTELGLEDETSEREAAKEFMLRT